MLSNVDCSGPAGNGSLELKGSASGLAFSSYDFVLVSSKVPAQAALSLVRHSRPGIPDDVNASGVLNATVQLSRSDMAQPVQLQGAGAAQQLRTSSPSVGAEIALGEVPISVVAVASNTKSRRVRATKPGASVGTPAKDSRLEFGPVNVALGRATPIHARASLTLSGYQAAVRGDAGLKQLLQSARLLGIPAPAFAADGSASVDLTIAGSWTDPRPTVLGTAQLRSVRAQVRGLNAPLEIANANLVLDTDSVRVQNLNASAAQSNWRGSLQVARPCVSPGACKVQFNLRTV